MRAPGDNNEDPGGRRRDPGVHGSLSGARSEDTTSWLLIPVREALNKTGVVSWYETTGEL